LEAWWNQQSLSKTLFLLATIPLRGDLKGAFSSISGSTTVVVLREREE
jgi:hypothetical protein